jgi:hypothetical protein
MTIGANTFYDFKDKECLMSLSNPPTMADDTLEGAAEIAAFTGKTLRQTHYLLETKQLPAFKLGGRWHMRRSTYTAHIEKLEAEAAG